MPNMPLEMSLIADQSLPVQHLDAGEKVFLVDDAGDCLYVVISGCVEIITAGRNLEIVEPGGIFGEIALIDQGPRSASALAARDTEVVKIDRAAFLSLVREQPTFALNVMATLAARVRRTSSPD